VALDDRLVFRLDLVSVFCFSVLNTSIGNPASALLVVNI
jgi:hypothetical protein